ncbi:MAG: glycoside hydrolase family 65 protein [Saprospiraceae bacterium]|nr:glycoside hydrolase family 65 protein [Saprospiraceae bacterium]
MKNYLKTHPWKIIEEGFHPEYQKNSESIFSLGNGRMGGRANFEESYSGETLLGNYIGGIYYPDKTRVGWWKVGYPEYYAKVPNAANWSGVHIYINNHVLDLAKCKIHSFKRILHLDKGYLERNVSLETEFGIALEIQVIKYLSMAWDECGAMQYSVYCLQDSLSIRFESYCDFNIRNQDSNYDEDFWNRINEYQDQTYLVTHAETKKTNYQVCSGIQNKFYINGELKLDSIKTTIQNRYVSNTVECELKEGDCFILEKSVCQISSLDYSKEEIGQQCISKLTWWSQIPFDQRLDDQQNYWQEIWKYADVRIEGDDDSQQGIRFNIFQLYQTYTGKDPRLNIGPKGFTGERYGGCTYWDTEAYCLPFYLGTSHPKVARQLLLYRYFHLPKAIENAKKLGFSEGAALYPMVTMNGEECHNEWEITFEEIHRNGAIVYAIFDYLKQTNDIRYVWDYGIEVIIAINRFWVQRVHLATTIDRYVMHGVTGPNEYENNVNNNWYTLYLAKWCLDYGLQLIDKSLVEPLKYDQIIQKTKLNQNEIDFWKEVSDKMYLPEDKNLGIFLQQDGYLEKEQNTVLDLVATERPIHQHWSWDRILRSCYIKQADVLQGIYFFEDHFDIDTIRKNFEYYEARTVHESSLSPCVHCILAARLNKQTKAYELYLRTSRLDLDDYNNDTCDGLHITSMAGTWLSIVKGFGGLRIVDDAISIKSLLPEAWKAFAFTFMFRDQRLKFKILATLAEVENQSNQEVKIIYKTKEYRVPAQGKIQMS